MTTPDTSADPVEVATRALRAFVEGDRDAFESLLADDFQLISPFSDELDRAAYLAAWWPHHEEMADLDILDATAQGERAWIRYRALSHGRPYRNAEVYTVRDGRIVEGLVFGGWEPAPDED